MMTELEAINQILSVTGDAPVSSVTSSYEQAQIARRILGEVSRQLQSKGWWFNELVEHTLLADSVTGSVLLPANTIRCEVIYNKNIINKNIIQRGTKLFDKENATYNIGEEVDVNLTQELEWVELPQSFRQFALAKAKERYNLEYYGAPEVAQSIAIEINQFYIELEKEDIENRDINMLRSTRAYSIAFSNRR